MLIRCLTSIDHYVPHTELQVVHQKKKLQLIYLHGFASGPHGSKARYFAERCREIGRDIVIPDLNHPDFERMTITSQIKLVEDLICDESGQSGSVIIGSSLGFYAARYFDGRYYYRNF